METSSFKPVERDLEYEKNNRTECDDDPGNVGFRCKNYKLCQVVIPEFHVEISRSYTCLKCQFSFGRFMGCDRGKGVLGYKESIDCPSCLDEDVEGMSYRNCNHFFCIPCLRRFFWGKDNIEYPDCPYDLNDEEFRKIIDEATPEELENHFVRYPLLREFYKEFHRIDALNIKIEEENDKEHETANLEVCPLCRQ